MIKKHVGRNGQIGQNVQKNVTVAFKQGSEFVSELVKDLLVKVIYLLMGFYVGSRVLECIKCPTILLSEPRSELQTTISNYVTVFSTFMPQR